MPSDPAIEITDLHVTLGGAPRVAGFSLNVAEGQFHGLLGPNGAGKTTVLRSLYRAQRIDAGELRIAGRAIHDWPQSDWAGTVGALVQEGGTFQGLSVRDVIEIGMMGLPLSGPERAARIDARTMGSHAMQSLALKVWKMQQVCICNRPCRTRKYRPPPRHASNLDHRSRCYWTCSGYRSHRRCRRS